MGDTITRFENGVHAEGSCGKNKSGYAAMGTVVGKDVHKLGSIMGSSVNSTSPHPSKKTFAYSDILAYIFMKVLLRNKMDSVYILFLSPSSFLSSTMQDIISSSSQMMSIIIVVQPVDDGFLVTKTFKKYESSCIYRNQADLVKLLSSVGQMEDTFAIVHPTISPTYKSIINQCSIKNWCVPSSRSEIYVSTSSDGFHFHNVFPWSRSPGYSGFTIGRGSIGIGSTVERHRYIGAFNSYEGLVSSVPIGNSCTDCIVLRGIAKSMQILTGKASTKHRHTMSESSIIALEEAKEMIKRMVEESTK